LSKIKTHDIHGEEQQAWRPKRIYHMIQDRFSEPDFVIDISQEIDQKLASIEAYTSQFYSKNTQNELTYISNPEFWEQIKSRSRMLGKRIGVSHGEGFHCENTIGLEDLDALKLPNLA
jgi:LmbE family N-acetylglucosaminyl deacetylase